MEGRRRNEDADVRAPHSVCASEVRGDVFLDTKEFVLSKYKYVYFEPWVGPDYDRGGLWGRKVLIVGESHYDEWADEAEAGQPPLPVTKHHLSRNFTQECVQDILEGGKGAVFWKRILNRVGGHEYEDRSLPEFWNRVAFYNLVQSPVCGGPGRRPTTEQWNAIEDPLREVIAVLKPDRILFTGWTMWGYVPPRDGVCEPIVAGDQKIPLEYFLRDDGTPAFVTSTAHPRTQYFVRRLSPLLHDFVVRDWAPAPQNAWSDELKDETRSAVENFDPTQSRDGKLCLKHGSGSFGSVEAEDVREGRLRVVDRNTQGETTYANVEELIGAGWAVD